MNKSPFHRNTSAFFYGNIVLQIHYIRHYRTCQHVYRIVQSVNLSTVHALIMRVGETLALRWKDINLSCRRLHVRSTVVRLANKKQSYVQDCPKSESSNRMLPLTPKAISLLQMLKVNAESEWVFVGDDGRRLSYEALRYQTQCLCRTADVPYRGEHVFRHTFATNCYHKGVDVKILSRLLEHADVNITYNIYVHLYGDGFDEMYEALVGK